MTSACMVVQGHYEVDIRVRRKAEALAAAGFSVDVLALHSRFSQPDTPYSLNGVNIHTLALRKKRGSLIRYAYEYLVFFLWVAYKVARLMPRRRYSIMDVNTLPDFLVFAPFFVRWRGAKIVLDMHEITPEFYMSKYKIREGALLIRLLKWVERACMHYADHVITINEPVQRLLETRGLPRTKSTIIMNSADDKLFVTNADVVAEPDVQAERARYVMMYHGTLTHIYGLDIAIKAFAMARHFMPGAEFWILGDGPERVTLQRLARELKTGCSIKFIDTVLPQDVHRWVRQCDVGVLPTRQDVFLDYSYSNKLSEYVIMGKAVICSRLRTISHYFSDESLAFFEPTNPQDLAEKMVRLFGDADLRDRLADCARRQLQPINWDVMKGRYLKLIERLAGRDMSSGVRLTT